MTGKSVFLLFESEEAAKLGILELEKLLNYEEKPFKCSLIPNFQANSKKPKTQEKPELEDFSPKSLQ